MYSYTGLYMPQHGTRVSLGIYMLHNNDCSCGVVWCGCCCCAVLCCAVLCCVSLQVLKAITAGLFMNAAQYDHTEYDPKRTNDAGSNVYRLLRHVQPRESRLLAARQTDFTKAVVVDRVSTRMFLAGLLLILHGLRHPQTT